MKHWSQKLLFIFFLVILLSPAGYIYRYHPNSTFWDNTFGNLLATLAALVAGVPVGLWINRSIQKQEEDNKFHSERIRERDILNLIKEELDFALNSLFLPSRKGNTAEVQIQPYKVELWDALIAGEELKYIHDSALLNRIASAYYALKLAKDIETHAYIALGTSALIFTRDGQQQSAAQCY